MGWKGFGVSGQWPGRSSRPDVVWMGVQRDGRRWVRKGPGRAGLQGDGGRGTGTRTEKNQTTFLPCSPWLALSLSVGCKRGPQEGCGRSSGAIRRKGENLCLSLVHPGREVTFHGPSCCVALEVARTSRCSLSERACTAYFVRHPAKHQGTPQRHHLLREWWPAECRAVLPRCVGDGGTLVNERERHVSRCRKGILAVVHGTVPGRIRRRARNKCGKRLDGRGWMGARTAKVTRYY